MINRNIDPARQIENRIKSDRIRRGATIKETEKKKDEKPKRAINLSYSPDTIKLKGVSEKVHKAVIAINALDTDNSATLKDKYKTDTQKELDIAQSNDHRLKQVDTITAPIIKSLEAQILLEEDKKKSPDISDEAIKGYVHKFANSDQDITQQVNSCKNRAMATALLSFCHSSDIRLGEKSQARLDRLAFVDVNKSIELLTYELQAIRSNSQSFSDSLNYYKGQQI